MTTAHLCIGGPLDGQWIASTNPHRLVAFGSTPIIHDMALPADTRHGYHNYSQRSFADLNGNVISLWVLDDLDNPFERLTGGYLRPKAASL